MCVCRTAHFWDKRNVLNYHVPHKKCHAYFYHFPPIFWISWYLLHKKLPQIKPQEFIGHIKKHFITSHQRNSTFSKMLYEKNGYTSTFDPTTYLVDYKPFLKCVSTCRDWLQMAGNVCCHYQKVYIMIKLKTAKKKMSKKKDQSPHSTLPPKTDKPILQCFH